MGAGGLDLRKAGSAEGFFADVLFNLRGVKSGRIFRKSNSLSPAPPFRYFS
jgi:hypothetical protein